MKIKKVEIEGFRAYRFKEDGTFDFTNKDDTPSNFVAIYAPNGFGKSSFYDAVEWAITHNLDRFAGEYNKKNYEQAARSTKEDGVAQKILRNKDVPDDIPTRVTVFTTLPTPFEQSLGTVRSDSRDIRIGENKNKINGYFRKVVLSQDEIDRFLKEAKPQDRYKMFMESFGGEWEKARQELTILLNDNKAVLLNLEKNKNELQEQLDQPVDASTFIQFNKIASELVVEGESLPLVDETTIVNTQHELLEKIITRSHEINFSLNKKKILRDSISEYILKFPDISFRTTQINEKKNRLEKINKGIEDVGRYKTFQSTLEKLTIEKKKISQSLNFIEELDSLSQEFLSLEFNLESARKKHRELSYNYENEKTLLDNLFQTRNQNDADLSSIDKRCLSIRSTLENATVTYSNISNIQNKILNIVSTQTELEHKLNQVRSEYQKNKSELNKVSDLTITAKSLLSSDLSLIDLSSDLLKELNNLSQELNILVLHDQSIHNTQESLSAQMGVHERLIASGLEYLSLWPTNICPLCHKPHDSESSLREQVTNTDVISMLSKENAAKLEISSKRRSELNGKIEYIVQKALEIKMSKLEVLSKKVNQQGNEIHREEQHYTALLAEKQSVQNQLNELQKAVAGLTKDELLARLDAELKELETKKNEVIKNKLTLTKNINVKKTLITELSGAINLLNTQIHEMMSSSNYSKTKAYSEENGLSSEFLKEHYDDKRHFYVKNINGLNFEINNITSQLKDLQKAMIAEEMWLDYEEMISEKKNLEDYISKSEAVLQSYSSLLKQHFELPKYESLVELKDFLISSLDKETRLYNGLEERLRKYYLLSELLKTAESFVKSIKLQNDINEILGLIEIRKEVDLALTKERNQVIEELRNLIKSFFYEELINSIYKRIDPHPSLKKVVFRPDFDSSDKPGLNIVVSDEKGDMVSPILFFSAAQLNILSLSVFLASALHAKDDNGNVIDVIMIDDPIQSMDSINILSTIDLLRSITVRFNKQIIISTHDDNFFGLLQRKIPSEILGAKFLKLEKFGVVVPVDDLNNT
ncbi:TPA: AAA family ATPase [Klebsiella aerogenes]